MLASALHFLGEVWLGVHFRPWTTCPPAVGKTKRSKGTKLMTIAEAHGLPIEIASASPHEVTLVENLL